MDRAIKRTSLGVGVDKYVQNTVYKMQNVAAIQSKQVLKFSKPKLGL